MRTEIDVHNEVMNRNYIPDQEQVYHDMVMELSKIERQSGRRQNPMDYLR